MIMPEMDGIICWNGYPVRPGNSGDYVRPHDISTHWKRFAASCGYILKPFEKDRFIWV
jgi:hypothetical protein